MVEIGESVVRQTRRKRTSYQTARRFPIENCDEIEYTWSSAYVCVYNSDLSG